MPQTPIIQYVDTVSYPMRRERHEPEAHLLRDCLAFSGATPRPPARLRLEEAVGEELAQRLLLSLTLGPRH